MFTDPRQAYKDTHATTSVSDASPHKLIALLFDACQENLAAAKGAMVRGEIRNKAYAIKKAIDIVVRLQAALDFEKGKELAQNNIAVNCVTPAAARTRIFDQMTEEHINYMLSKIPRNKFAKVEELASLVTWLASEENSFSTAAVFDLSGGRATY